MDQDPLNEAPEGLSWADDAEVDLSSLAPPAAADGVASGQQTAGSGKVLAATALHGGGSGGGADGDGAQPTAEGVAAAHPGAKEAADGFQVVQNPRKPRKKRAGRDSPAPGSPGALAGPGQTTQPQDAAPGGKKTNKPSATSGGGKKNLKTPQPYAMIRPGALYTAPTYSLARDGIPSVIDSRQIRMIRDAPTVFVSTRGGAFKGCEYVYYLVKGLAGKDELAKRAKSTQAGTQPFGDEDPSAQPMASSEAVTPHEDRDVLVAVQRAFASAMGAGSHTATIKTAFFGPSATSSTFRKVLVSIHVDALKACGHEGGARAILHQQEKIGSDLKALTAATWGLPDVSYHLPLPDVVSSGRGVVVTLFVTEAQYTSLSRSRALVGQVRLAMRANLGLDPTADNLRRSPGVTEHLDLLGVRAWLGPSDHRVLKVALEFASERSAGAVLQASDSRGRPEPDEQADELSAAASSVLSALRAGVHDAILASRREQRAYRERIRAEGWDGYEETPEDTANDNDDDMGVAEELQCFVNRDVGPGSPVVKRSDGTNTRAGTGPTIVWGRQEQTMLVVTAAEAADWRALPREALKMRLQQDAFDAGFNVQRGQRVRVLDVRMPHLSSGSAPTGAMCYFEVTYAKQVQPKAAVTTKKSGPNSTAASAPLQGAATGSTQRRAKTPAWGGAAAATPQPLANRGPAQPGTEVDPAAASVAANDSATDIAGAPQGLAIINTVLPHFVTIVEQMLKGVEERNQRMLAQMTQIHANEMNQLKQLFEAQSQRADRLEATLMELVTGGRGPPQGQLAAPLVHHPVSIAGGAGAPPPDQPAAVAGLDQALHKPAPGALTPVRPRADLKRAKPPSPELPVDDSQLQQSQQREQDPAAQMAVDGTPGDACAGAAGPAGDHMSAASAGATRPETDKPTAGFASGVSGKRAHESAKKARLSSVSPVVAVSSAASGAGPSSTFPGLPAPAATAAETEAVALPHPEPNSAASSAPPADAAQLC